ncbi:P22_AR N-terminal domain protein protein [Gallibacterium anatis UMN179]|uniref:p22_AR N-terminal domain protein protein n=1 Tax=Gallibacterium anatis (strain UMN179) TaxID=1005058 RepID=F4H9G2_GALAU|nr:phage antirepressor N-terminal domain-containing protein [Gallibacterium anatis]AEC18415.1 P22_AR N-terminal domain protein protein [Gallibacterium anatis UMN179]
MSNQNQLQTIQFNNQSLITFEQNSTHYVAMRPICENIGLAWNAQLLRIKRDEVLSQGMIVMITPTNGGEQEMVCLPIQYLNGWLFGIDVKRVKPEIRETLITYKRECYQALFDYWNKPKQQPLPLAEAEADEEAIRIIANLYHSLRGAFEMGEKIRKQYPYFAKEIDKTIGGHYLYNLNHPTEQALEKAKRYVHAKSERIMFIKGMLSLLDEQPQPKRLANF